VAAGEIPFSLRTLIRYTGYLAEGRPPGSGTICMPGPYCLTTVGGGSDGHALARVAVAARVPEGLGHLIVAGPEMPIEQLNDLRQQAGPGVKVVSTIDDLIYHLRNAAAVVSMGGYNTVCEIMSTNVPALIVPRIQARAEQYIRAASLANAGYLERQDIGTLTPEVFGGWLAARIGTTVDRRRAVLDGLIRVPQLAADLLQPLLRSSAGDPQLHPKEGAARVAV
jgi:predicted glycosyltransferase